MPLSQAEKAELAALRAKHGSPAPSSDQPPSGPQYGEGESAVQGFGKQALNALTFGHGSLAGAQAGIQRGAQSLEGLLGKAGIGPGAVDEDLRKKGFNVSQSQDPQDYDALKKQYEGMDDAMYAQNPMSYGAGSAGGAVAGNVGMGGMVGRGVGAAGQAVKGSSVGQAATNLLGRAAPLAGSVAEGAAQGAVTDLATKGELGAGTAVGAGIPLAGAALRAGGQIARSVGKFNNPGEAALEARDAVGSARQKLWDATAPEREAKMAALDKVSPVPEYAPESGPVVSPEEASTATRPIDVNAPEAPAGPAGLSGQEAEARGRQAQKLSKALNRGNYPSPEMIEAGQNAASQKAAEAEHYLGHVNANPEVAAANKPLSQTAGDLGAGGLGPFEKDPLKALLKATAGTAGKAVLQNVDAKGGASLEKLANELQQGKNYASSSLLHTVKNPLQSAIRMGSQASNAASGAANNDELRQALIQYMASKQGK